MYETSGFSYNYAFFPHRPSVYQGLFRRYSNKEMFGSNAVDYFREQDGRFEVERRTRYALAHEFTEKASSYAKVSCFKLYNQSISLSTLCHVLNSIFGDGDTLS